MTEIYSKTTLSFYKNIFPQAVMLPVVAAFWALVEVNKDGAYSWIEPPLDTWKEN